MAATLSILCVTKGETCVLPLLTRMKAAAKTVKADWVLVADGLDAYESLIQARLAPRVMVNSQGYLESVHDTGLKFCGSEYVLRLDDDESLPEPFVKWLRCEQYRDAPHWRFARLHLWGDEDHALANAPLWPDYQTRLSLVSMAGGRNVIHGPSPFGKGNLSPMILKHHKFLIRSRADRERQAAQYESIKPGAGSGKFLQFQVPEAAYPILDVQPITAREAVTA